MLELVDPLIGAGEGTNRFHIGVDFISADIFFGYIHAFYGNILESHVAEFRQIFVDAFFAGVNESLFRRAEIAGVQLAVLYQLAMVNDNLLSLFCSKRSNLYNTGQVSAEIDQRDAIAVFEDSFWLYLFMSAGTGTPCIGTICGGTLPVYSEAGTTNPRGFCFPAGHRILHHRKIRHGGAVLRLLLRKKYRLG